MIGTIITIYVLGFSAGWLFLLAVALFFGRWNYEN